MCTRTALCTAGKYSKVHRSVITYIYLQLTWMIQIDQSTSLTARPCYHRIPSLCVQCYSGFQSQTGASCQRDWRESLCRPATVSLHQTVLSTLALSACWDCRLVGEEVRQSWKVLSDTIERCNLFPGQLRVLCESLDLKKCHFKIWTRNLMIIHAKAWLDKIKKQA